jgi:hypothetical protein
MSDFGFWILDFGFWILHFGFRIADCPEGKPLARIARREAFGSFFTLQS